MLLFPDEKEQYRTLFCYEHSGFEFTIFLAEVYFVFSSTIIIIIIMVLICGRFFIAVNVAGWSLS